MARLTPEEKLAEQFREAMDNHWFNPQIFAGLIVDNNTYYQNILYEVIEAIIHNQDVMYHRFWEHGGTCDGLMRSSYLSEVLKNRYGTK